MTDNLSLFFITGDGVKAFEWISVTTVGIDLSIDAMTNFLNAIRIHYISCHIFKFIYISD